MEIVAYHSIFPCTQPAIRVSDGEEKSVRAAEGEMRL